MHAARVGIVVMVVGLVVVLALAEVFGVGSQQAIGQALPVLFAMSGGAVLLMVLAGEEAA